MFSKHFKLAAALVAASTLSAAQASAQVPGQLQPVHAEEAGAAQVREYPAGHTYPQLHAPLYPSPVQYTPAWNGGTFVTNQALAPHEMLYPHTYKAMYGPYYYKVTGGWVWTPFGMRQHEEVKLEGTEVCVKYRSHIPLFANWRAPRNDISLINCWFNR